MGAHLKRPHGAFRPRPVRPYRSQHPWHSLTAALGVVLVACAGTETGNPPFAGELAYNTYSTAPAVAALRVAEGGVKIDSAWIVLGDARFLPADRCDQPAEASTHVPGLGAGDHATPAAARTPFELPEGEYCGLQLPLALGDADTLPADAPGELADHSIVLQGQRADGGRLLIASQLEVAWRLEAAEGAFYMGPDNPRVLIGFDVAVWLGGIDVDGATVDARGNVSITPEENSELLRKFEENLSAGLNLYRDPDGTGTVAEAGEPIASGER